MRTAYRVETVRAAERALMAALPGGTLMARAAAGLAAVVARRLGRRRYGARVVLLVGGGDNGGDALYAGARLARRGTAVTAVLLRPDRAHAGGLAALRAAGGRTTGADAPGTGPLLARADLVVDGITGIGGRGGLRPDAAALVARVAAAGVPVVAVDLPSGVDADSGEVRGEAVRAAVTVTFGAYKPGLLIDPGSAYAGEVLLVDIGLGPHLPPEADAVALSDADVAALLPRPSGESDKYRRGVVGVVAGSERYPGAAVLAVAGALRGGAGAVRYAGPAAHAVVGRHPETLVSDGPPHRAGRVQAWVVGPGVGEDPDAAERVGEVLASDVPVLIDADGLRGLDPDRLRARTAPTLITPHAGEAARLLGADRADVEASRLASARELAARYGVTALLKGSTTVVADPAGRVRVNTTGTPWLATAGTGDVLSGLTGALLATGLSPLDAASTGAHLHGLAGSLAPVPPTASTVAEALPAAWRRVGAHDTGKADVSRTG
ncbi:NAD(P)H-hydrate dehydratase [Streptomyces sp. RFCAC02]|uniref:NAD(P)H-hydrate dehydratase n=1 Tax=Streptomyces sp. RFCAC02 TaxID=2499143 RepID=UPI0010206986|nr:NAD(P)H-hydrate dehydratase [Streptomyces sp. RFCAC02]